MGLKEKRAAKIGRSADLVLCLFPMEPPIYARHHVDARFVGHPMADAIPEHCARAAARVALGLPEDAPVLAVLPGSRLGEIDRLGETFFEAAWRVREQMPGLHLVVPAANAGCRALLAEQLGSVLPADSTRLVDGHAREAMVAADVVLLASGTATLEAMLVKRPMVVGYKVAPLTYRIVKALNLIKVERFALPNLLSGKDLAPELIQDDCTPERLAEAVLGWLRNPQAGAALLPEYARLHALLKRDASARAAEAVDALIASRPGRP
jgi:lipid-A-disaccharide synthase